MREKNKIAIYITTKSRQATTYLSGFFNYLQLMRKIDCTGSFFSFLFFLNLPFADGSLGAVKADTHFY